MNRALLFLILILPIVGTTQVSWNWVRQMDNDFSFVEKWEYDEGIYVNKWGQLSCDGLCPIEIDVLKDEQGRIIDDSLSKFYSIIDTTHRYFTHEGIVRAYEFDACNHVYAKKHDYRIHLQTKVGIATHTSLHIEFFPDPGSKIPFRAYLIYNSIRDQAPKKYFATNGTIDISSEALYNGMIQMSFDLEFELDEDDLLPQTWKGKILLSLPE
ncbi:MAG: hypothetical protein COA38_12370 [Fluviicola sp.]|nr:MAG: hypothetical protein COA38_12370 [Fluviicola sp.]